MAKSRLAPLKPLTIPRLELCAATLATRQDAMLRRELDVEIASSHFWTDSTLVLQYVRSEDRRFHTYVSNRVTEIRGRTELGNWHHVPTKDNPADDASRGLSASGLMSSRWQQGPAFLSQPPSVWPTLNLSPLDSRDPELKRAPIASHLIVAQDDPIERLLNAYSDWTRLLRAVAWVLLVRDACRQPDPMPDALQAEDLDRAEEAVLYYVQSTHFEAELKSLAETGKVQRRSKLAALQPKLRGRLMVTGGRLKHAAVPEHTRYPVILPKTHHVVVLLTRDAHRRTAHSGRGYVMAELRQKYWVVGGVSVVRQVLRQCVSCKVREPRPCAQRMADLPADRVTAGGSAFKSIGVDCFGPFTVKRGRGTARRYGCLFTCLVTRAIHIEVVPSLDTDSFLNAFYRFMARRGEPEVVRSDNGANFVRADLELRREMGQVDSARLGREFADRRIKWLFNTPLASHMGGVWERQIRTVRRVLSSLTREQLLTDESLHTLMTIAEGIVNNRPVTSQSDDPRDLDPLTPSHLLLLRPASMPNGVFHDADQFGRRRWRQVQYLADLFWKRWTREYLPTLRARTKWTGQRRNVQVDDLVIVIEHTLPRNEWLLGRIVEALPGPDGLVRSVRVRTSRAVLTRPVTKVCVLEEAGGRD